MELIGSYEILNGLVQFRNGVTTTENINGQNVTLIDGGKISTNKVLADKIFAEDITAKGTITGATLKSADISTIKGKIGPFEISEGGLIADSSTTGGIRIPYTHGDETGYVQIGKISNN